MATTTFDLKPSQSLPVGASVAAYPLSNWPNGIPNTGAAPIGAATNTQTMGATGLTFTGLTAGTRYVAYTLVGSDHRYVRFTVGTVAELDPGSEATQEALGLAVVKLAAVYRNLHVPGARITTAGAAATPYVAANGADLSSLAINGSVSVGGVMVFRAADWAVADLTTKLRLRAILQTTNTAPAVTVTVSLQRLTQAGTSWVLGGAIAGSTLTFTTPAASTPVEPDTAPADIAAPADGQYGVIYTLSGIPAGNCALETQVQVHQVP